ncbi:MAG: hypothetical protein ACK4QW_19335, partial [Alphaproteobacteria bacterium]
LAACVVHSQNRAARCEMRTGLAHLLSSWRGARLQAAFATAQEVTPAARAASRSLYRPTLGPRAVRAPTSIDDSSSNNVT